MKKIILAAAAVMCLSTTNLMAQEAAPVKRVETVTEVREEKVNQTKAQMGQVKAEKVKKEKEVKEIKQNEGKRKGHTKPHTNNGNHYGQMKEKHEGHKQDMKGHEGHDHDMKGHEGHNHEIKEQRDVEIKKVKE